MNTAGSPLFDTLFRPTTASATTASAAPVQVRGTRTRAGNAMNRTRAALMAGAARSVATSGTKITMAQVAAAAGVAKATLYNHFRTREAVLDALTVDQLTQLVDAQHGKAIELALVDVAHAISTSPVLRGLATVEPATLAGLARIDDRARAWRTAHAAVADALEVAGRGGVETVLRWFASFLLTPGDPAAIAADAAVLLAGLPVVAPSAGTRDPLSA